MHRAVKYGNLAELKLVVAFAPERINETDCDGWTPLHHAAQYDQEAVVSLLLSAKADVNKTNNYGSTPLHQAAVYFATGDRVKQLTPLYFATGDRVKQLLRDAGGHR